MLDITFINVGYGEAILLTYNEAHYLIDGGSTYEEEFIGNRISLCDYLEKHHITHLEAVIITHIHEDHVSGIQQILSTVEVGAFFLPYFPQITQFKDLNVEGITHCSTLKFAKALQHYKDVLTFIEKYHIPSYNLIEARMFTIDQHLHISTLEPTIEKAKQFSKRIEDVFTESDQNLMAEQLAQMDADSNDYSTVFQLTYHTHSVFLTADNCPKNWSEETFDLLKNGNVLKLPHHGQIDAINTHLLDNLRAQYIITTSSSDRRHNSSHPEVYHQLRQRYPHLQFLFTDEVDYQPFTTIKRNYHEALTLRFTDTDIKIM